MIPLAISPCPNDTFLCHAWIKGLVGTSLIPTPIFADIDQLNRWALEKRFPLIKVSFSCLKQLLNDYQLLPVGAALGRGCGPKIVAKTPFPIGDLSSKRIGVPGNETTAHLLLNFFFPSIQDKVFCRYDQIASLLHDSSIDCGLIIHESRFTFKKEGFFEWVDLGALWEEKFDLPLPLGGIVARQDLPKTMISDVITALQSSLQHAWRYPEESLPFILEHSQEKNREVVKKHIDLYVNEETLSLSPIGMKAINTLLALA